MSPPRRLIAALPARKNRALNPFQFLLYEALEPHGYHADEFERAVWRLPSVHAVHLHWPDGAVLHPSLAKTVYRLFAFFALLALYKLMRIPVVWTAHNIRSHDALHPRLETLLWALLYPCLDAVITLKPVAEQPQLTRHPVLRTKPFVHIPHGEFASYYREVGPSDRRTVQPHPCLAEASAYEPTLPSAPSAGKTLKSEKAEMESSSIPGSDPQPIEDPDLIPQLPEGHPLQSPFTSIGHAISALPRSFSLSEFQRFRFSKCPPPRRFLVFGHVRPYKRIPEIIRAFRAHPDPHARLIIAGRCLDAALSSEIDTLTAADPRVTFRNELIPDSDVAALFDAADALVLAPDPAKNSGILHLAASFGVPVIGLAAERTDWTHPVCLPKPPDWNTLAAVHARLFGVLERSEI